MHIKKFVNIIRFQNEVEKIKKKSLTPLQQDECNRIISQLLGKIIDSHDNEECSESY